MNNIKKLKTAINILDLIAEQVPLKKQGTNHVGLCPFHNEKTPSFTVFPETQTFKCFGCGKQGDIIDFTKEIEQCEFQEAVNLLSKKHNIEITKNKSMSRDFEQKQQMFITNQIAKKHFQQNLAEPQKDFLYKKGLTETTIEFYEIGYSLASQPIKGLIEKPEYEEEDFINAGLLKASKTSGNIFDFFWEEGLIFPIHNKNRHTTGFARRSQTSDIKYLNTRETLVYKKSKMLYGLHHAKKAIVAEDEVIVVEGYTDVMAMHQSGKTNTVGVCGTAFTEEQIDELLMLTKNITLIFDGDNAGAKALEKAIFKCTEKGTNVRCVILPENTDPCDLLKMTDMSVADFINKYKQDALLFYSNNQLVNKVSPIDKGNAYKKIGQLLSKISSVHLFETYVTDISQRFSIGKRALRKIIEEEREIGEAKDNNISEAIINGIEKMFHIKIRDTYFEKYVAYDSEFGSYSITWVTRKATELKREFGEKYLNEIPRFNGMTVEPEHFKFKFVHSFTHEGKSYRDANFYHQIPYFPKPFVLPVDWDKGNDYDISQFSKIKNTLQYLEHVFGKDWMKGLDYFSILYKYPKRPLPALCLVSREKGTGKSTLINFMRAIFGENVTKSSAKRLSSNFNKFLLGKLIVGIEETNDEKGAIQEELKDMITGREMVIEGKGQDSFIIQSFVKFIFCSNYPETFLKGGDDDRLIVIEVPVIPEGKKDNDMLKKMVREIPYFLFFLQNRKIRTPDKGRLWFERWETPALLRLQEASQPRTLKYVENLISELFLKCKFRKEFGNANYLREIKLSSRALANYLNKHNSTHTFKGHALTRTLNNQGLFQSTHTTRFNYPKVDVEAIGDWHYEWGKDTAKYYSFDMIDYVSPEDIRVNYTIEEIRQLFNSEEIKEFGLLLEPELSFENQDNYSH